MENYYRPLVGEPVRSYCQRLRKTWEIVKDIEITEEKFLLLVQINAGRFAECIDSLMTEEKATLENVIKGLLLRFDLTAEEYRTAYKEARPEPNESMIAFATRLKGLYIKSRDDAEISNGEQKLIIEQFLDALGPNDATLLRIAASNEELNNLDLIAKRASRLIRNRSQNHSINTVTTECETASDNEVEDDNKFYVQEDDALLSIVGLKTNN